MTAVVVTTPQQAMLGLGGRPTSPPSSRWTQYQAPPRQAHAGGGGGGGGFGPWGLHGLNGAHELTGLQGTVGGGLDASGRYTVRPPGATVVRSRSVPRAPPQQFRAARLISASPAKTAADGGGFGLGSPLGSTAAPAAGWASPVELHDRTGSGSPARARSVSPARARSGLGSPAELDGRSGSVSPAKARSGLSSPLSSTTASSAGWASPAQPHGQTISVSPARARGGPPHGGKWARGGRADRRQVRVLVIGTGYGRMLNPAQYGMLTNAGFQVNMVDGLPNPEESHRAVESCLQQIKAKIDQFAPHVVTAASKGGPYLVRLWETGMWRGPSVLINAHPSCSQLPRDCPIVICQGEEDEFYRVRREAAEALIATGSPDKTLLYWVPSSGRLPQGMRPRHGDTHNMKSLVQNDTLPRLVDAVLDPDGPEVHLVRSWRERLSEGRLQAEAQIGYTPEALQQRWQSLVGTLGRLSRPEDQKLWDVQRNSDEYQCVEEMVRAAPTEPATYNTGPHLRWTRPIVAIQRIENGPQVHGCAVPYYDSLRMDIEAQGLDFEPGVHTVWTFHGTNSANIDSIVNDPVGLRPNFAGSKGASVWGRGTYLARDARYVGEAGFCGQPAADGTRRMLACLTFIGMPCAADPRHTGLLPYRCGHHRYHSSVDHLSNPEVFVAVQAGAVLPAYVITFR